MRLIILGSGSSSGTPALDLGWGDCDPNNPRNRRLRPAVLVEHAGTRLLVDTPPDLREQLLTAGVNRLDAVLFTHGHADHLHGIDDLRGINRTMGRALDAYGDARTLDETRRRFGYVFEPLPSIETGYYKPVLIPHEISPGDAFRVGEVDITVFGQDHGYGDTLGFRFGPIAYSTDLTTLPEEAFHSLAGVHTWIIGTLGETPHPTHAHVDKALGWIARIKPTRAVLTHLGVNVDYETLRAKLPPGVEPAYDGMVLETA